MLAFFSSITDNVAADSVFLWLPLGRSIPVDSYSSSIEQQTSLDRQELPGSLEQSSMARSQSAPMLDDELGFPGHGVGNHNQQTQNQKPSIPQKAYHFDHNYNPQVRHWPNMLWP